MSTATPSFYNLAWRWHFYAGLFVAPFMILLSLTGIIYLFKPQLDPLMYRQLMVVPVVGQRLTADQLLERVHAAYPQASISQYLAPPASDRSGQFVIKEPIGVPVGGSTGAPNRELKVFIDPYTGKLLGRQDAALNLQAIARALHGELMIGTVGDRLVELAAGWGIVLVVSGLYLWWPRAGNLASGVLWPRWRSRGRALWRDIHGVVGFWGSILLLFMLISGMTWTGFWGKQFAGVWNRFPDAMWNQVPTSDLEARSLNTAARQTVPWALENTPMPMSMSGAHAEHRQHRAAPNAPAAPSISLQSLIDIADQRGITPGYSITLPSTDTGVFTLAVFADDPRHDATLHVDQYTGQVLADVRWKDYGYVARATEMGVMLHEGKLLGPINQIAILLVCLLVLLSAISGLLIWWKRRPQGALGVPPLRHDLPRWKTAVGVMIVLGLVFPLVGASLLVIWTLDWAVLSQLRRRSAANC